MVPFLLTDTAPTEIYTLSLHDALPISPAGARPARSAGAGPEPPGPAATPTGGPPRGPGPGRWPRSEEHTSELQSLTNLVCRLLLEKKKFVARGAKAPASAVLFLHSCSV